MSSRIALVGWDADRVMYNDLITSICARHSQVNPRPYVRRFVDEMHWFTYDDVDRWAAATGKDPADPVKTVGDLADCLTAFLYTMTKPDSAEPVLTKQQTIDAKQLILGGLTVRQIRDISESIEYTPGLIEAVEAFIKQDRLTQTLFSDGLGPHIHYQYEKLHLDAGAGVPPIVSHGGREFEYYRLCPEDAVLTGRIGKFDKTAAFFGYLGSMHEPMSNVAVIDDSGANVKTLLVPVRDAGGLAVGFNVTDAHGPAFKAASIPIIKGKDLTPFVEMVRDPSEATIGRYCE